MSPEIRLIKCPKCGHENPVQASKLKDNRIGAGNCSKCKKPLFFHDDIEGQGARLNNPLPYTGKSRNLL